MSKRYWKFCCIAFAFYYYISRLSFILTLASILFPATYFFFCSFVVYLFAIEKKKKKKVLTQSGISPPPWKWLGTKKWLVIIYQPLKWPRRLCVISRLWVISIWLYVLFQLLQSILDLQAILMKEKIHSSSDGISVLFY